MTALWAAASTQRGPITPLTLHCRGGKELTTKQPQKLIGASVGRWLMLIVDLPCEPEACWQAILKDLLKEPPLPRSTD